jgi:[ribosomal protein S5]-alanine N-acetyltransferase
MRVEGTRCAVRPWRMADADAIVKHANNPNIARQLRDRFPHPYTRRDALEFLEHALSAEPSAHFAIEVDGQAVGGLGFVRGSDVERYSAEIGYWLGESFWGRGITTESVALVTRHAFTETDLLRLFALPFADNTASRRVLEKAGYTCEGILRASAVKFGEPRDQALYSRINAKWNRLETRGVS